jgi:hypothetical protein
VLDACLQPPRFGRGPSVSDVDVQRPLQLERKGLSGSSVTCATCLSLKTRRTSTANTLAPTLELLLLVGQRLVGLMLTMHSE